MQAPLLRVLVAVALSGAVGFAVARHRQASKKQDVFWPDARELHVPHVHGSITLDGDTDDSGWRGPSARTGAFVSEDGTAAVHPHSEARLVWEDGFLYLNLYAADEDIRATSHAPDAIDADEDAFHLVFTDRTSERFIEVTPLGIVTDAMRGTGSSGIPDRTWDSHLHVSHELDGTPNRSRDNDEEWVLEMAIPLESLGLDGKPGERVGFSVHRCDTPHDGKRVCGNWGEAGKHAVLVLD